jgi:hypothetical protein
MVWGLSLRPNLPEVPAATWNSRRSIKEEEEEFFLKAKYLLTLSSSARLRS